MNFWILGLCLHSSWFVFFRCECVWEVYSLGVWEFVHFSAGFGDCLQFSFRQQWSTSSVGSCNPYGSSLASYKLAHPQEYDSWDIYSRTDDAVSPFPTKSLKLLAPSLWLYRTTSSEFIGYSDHVFFLSKIRVLNCTIIMFFSWVSKRRNWI